MVTKNLTLMKQWIQGAGASEQTSIRFPPPIATTIPFHVIDVGDGTATVECATDPDSQANPMGTIHGGVLCTIADAAIGVAHWSGLEEGESFTSVDLRINFFRPVWRDMLRAIATKVHGGRSVTYYTCDIVRGDGKLVAQVTSTIMTLRGDMARGR